MTPASARSASRQLLPVIPLDGSALFFAAFVLPLAALVADQPCSGTRSSRQLSLVQYLRFLSDPFSIKVLSDTARLGAEVALAALILAYPLALGLSRAARPVHPDHLPDHAAALLTKHGGAHLRLDRDPRP